MDHKMGIRLAAATVMSAMALGVAAPAAEAVEADSRAGEAAAAAAEAAAAAAAAAEDAEVPISKEHADAFESFANASETHWATPAVAKAGGKGEAFKQLLKRSGKLLKSACRAAKKGHAAFRKWMSKQHWTIRAAWKILGWETQEQIIDWLISIAQSILSRDVAINETD